jgi:hypothetical protein
LSIPFPLRALKRAVRPLARRIYARRPPPFGIYDPKTQRVVPRLSADAGTAPAGTYDPSRYGLYSLADEIPVPRSGERDLSGLFNLDTAAAAAQACAQGDVAPPLSADRYAIVLRALEPGSGLLLDACTANPRPDVVAAVSRLGYRYQAIDFHGAADRSVMTEDLTRLSFGAGSVARILSCDTLEHITDYRAALREMFRVLQPGGLLLLHMPVYWFDREDGEPMPDGPDEFGHVRYFSAREVMRAAAAAGFVLLRSTAILDYGATFCIFLKPPAG